MVMIVVSVMLVVRMVAVAMVVLLAGNLGQRFVKLVRIAISWRDEQPRAASVRLERIRRGRLFGLSNLLLLLLVSI